MPTFNEFMLPLLQLVDDRQEYHIRNVREKLATYFQLSDEQLRELLPSGKQTTFANRVSWAKTYLTQAGLLASTRRGWFRITEHGLAFLDQNPDRIDRNILMQFDDFARFQSGTTNKDKSASKTTNEPPEILSETPEEVLDSTYQLINQNLGQELLEYILERPPEFFERLVVELVVGMGYGGSIVEAGKAVGKSGDGGIDGIIKEDLLGFEVIYLQAKRYALDNPISRPAIQGFAGALVGYGVSKGLFITTSSFTSGAEQYANNLGTPKIILIDGNDLTDLMIEHNLGVTTRKTYAVKSIDVDYFEYE